MEGGANRVVVGLPLRYENAKRAVRDLERTLDTIRLLVSSRNFEGITESQILDQISNVLQIMRPDEELPVGESGSADASAD